MATGCYFYRRSKDGEAGTGTTPSPVYGVFVELGEKAVYATVPDVTVSISERRPSSGLSRTSLTIRRGNHTPDQGEQITVDQGEALLAITRLIPPASFCQETIEDAGLPGWTILFSSNVALEGKRESDQS